MVQDQSSFPGQHEACTSSTVVAFGLWPCHKYVSGDTFYVLCYISTIKLVFDEYISNGVLILTLQFPCSLGFNADRNLLRSQ